MALLRLDKAGARRLGGISSFLVVRRLRVARISELRFEFMLFACFCRAGRYVTGLWDFFVCAGMMALFAPLSYLVVRCLKMYTWPSSSHSMPWPDKRGLSTP